MKIEVRRAKPGQYHFRYIYADDVLMGSFVIKGHGPHGNSYHLRDVNNMEVNRTEPRGAMRDRYYVIPQRRYLHGLATGSRSMSRDERLIECAEEAIAAGHLVPRGAIAAREAERAEARKKAQEEQEAARVGAWNARAVEALVSIGLSGENDEDVEEIIAAMDWALTH